MVACAASEWGPNRLALADRGLRLVDLPVASDGLVDLQELSTQLDRLRPVWPALRTGDWPGEEPVARRLESREAHVAGRVALAQAVREHLDLGPEGVHQALAEVGRRTREALADLPGWTVCDRTAAPGAITTLLPPAGLTPAHARARLLAEHQVVTTAAAVERAPGEVTQPVLRLSPHVDVDEADLQRLRDALAALAAG